MTFACSQNVEIRRQSTKTIRSTLPHSVLRRNAQSQRISSMMQNNTKVSGSKNVIQTLSQFSNLEIVSEPKIVNICLKHS